MAYVREMSITYGTQTIPGATASGAPVTLSLSASRKLWPPDCRRVFRTNALGEFVVEGIGGLPEYLDAHLQVEAEEGDGSHEEVISQINNLVNQGITRFRVNIK